jgi:hypothetical protein
MSSMVLGSDSLAPGWPTQRWLSEWTICFLSRHSGEGRNPVSTASRVEELDPGLRRDGGDLFE